MPRIPKFISEKLPPGEVGGVPMSPDAASMTGQALVSASQRAGQALGRVENQVIDLYKKEKQADDAIKAAKMETDLSNKQREIAERLHKETDYEKYQDIVDSGIQEFQTLLPKNASRNLSIAFARASGQAGDNLKDVAQKKKWQEMDKQGKIAFIDIRNQAKDDYIKAQTDDERMMIMGNLQMKALALSESLAVDKLWLKAQIEAFETEARAEGQVRGAAILYEASKTDPVGVANRLRTDKEFMSYLEPDTRLKMQKQLDTAAEAFTKKEVVTAAYDKIRLATGYDPKKGMQLLLNPKKMEELGITLTLDARDQIRTSLSAEIAFNKHVQDDAQEENLNSIVAMAGSGNPQGALKELTALSTRLKGGSKEADPQKVLSLKSSLESHIRQMSLMSVQEKQVRIALEDDAKTKVKMKILSGGYTDQEKMRNDVIALGLTKTSEFLSEADSLLEKQLTKKGRVNYLAEAESDWDLMVKTATEKAVKKDRQEKGVKIKSSLADFIQKNGLSTDDPEVYEHYKKLKKAETDTWFTKFMGSFSDGATYDKTTGDYAIKEETKTVVDTEASMRAKLNRMGITGKNQDVQIAGYRERGLIK